MSAMNPSALLDTYESLLTSNLSAVRSIESGLRNVSWLLPGRFQDAEVASEGLYALINIVAGYHDGLLSKHLDQTLTLPPHPFAPQPWAAKQPARSAQHDDENGPGSRLRRTTPILPPPSDHARYTKYWTTHSMVYRKASRLLSTIGYIELLVEMLSKKKLGDRRRWRFVLGLEGLKTFLRLIILAVTKRPVLSPATPQREYDLLSLPSSLLHPTKTLQTATAIATTSSTSSAPISTPPKHSDEPFEALQTAAPPSGALTTSLPPHAPLRSHLFLLVGALPEDHLRHPLTLLPTLTRGQVFAEVISSSVVFIHVLLLLRSAPNRPTPSRHSLPTLSSCVSPYLIPLSLTLLARYLRPSNNPSILLSEHYAAQDRSLAMRAFLTGPMWVGWTRPKIMGLVHALGRVPLLGLVGDLAGGYVPLVDEYFYYTS